MSKTVVIAKRQTYTHEQKAQILSEYENSDLSQREFAKLHNISVQTLNSWRRGRGIKATKNSEESLPAVTSPQPQEVPGMQSIAVLQASNEALQGQVKRLTDEIFKCYAVLGKKNLDKEAMQLIS
jgi:transposase-like protein